MGQKKRVEGDFLQLLRRFSLRFLSVSCSFGERKVENNVYIKDINVGGKKRSRG